MELSSTQWANLVHWWNYQGRRKFPAPLYGHKNTLDALHRRGLVEQPQPDEIFNWSAVVTDTGAFEARERYLAMRRRIRAAEA